MLTETELQKFSVYKTALKTRYGDAVYDSWFKALSLLKLQNGHAVIGAPSKFSASQITERFSSGMFELWHKEIGPICQISIRGNKDLQKYVERSAPIHDGYREKRGAVSIPRSMPAKTSDLFSKKSTESPGAAKPVSASGGFTPSLASPLNAALTFDRFCIGEANRVAFVGARNVVERTDDRMFFLFGGSGRGKTHLLNAIGHEWLTRHAQDNVLYLTYDNLLNGYVSAVLSKSVPELRAYLDRIDILLVDDIHLLRGRKATQEELLCLVDRLISCGKTVVIAGAMASTKLAETGLNQRLADRIGGGACVPVEKPDLQLRMKILRQMAEQDATRIDFVCDEAALQIVARRCDNSVRELEGAYRLLRLNAKADKRSGNARQMTEDRVKALINEHLSCRPREVTLEDLKSRVASTFGLSVRDLESRKRMQPIVKGRHAFCLLARRLTEAPLKQIGAVIDRDHTTVLSSIDRGEVLAETNPVFGDRISQLMEEFER